MSRRAFTLVEVMTATAIVMLLAAIILSATRGAIGSAKRTHCAANLRQLYLAIKMYEDEEGAPPYPFHLYKGLVEEYPRARGILVCPADTSKGTEFWPDGPRFDPKLHPGVPPHSYDAYYFGDYWLHHVRQGWPLDPSDPNLVVAICNWHRRGPIQDSIVQAVFNDGRVAWYDERERTKWHKQMEEQYGGH